MSHRVQDMESSKAIRYCQTWSRIEIDVRRLDDSRIRCYVELHFGRAARVLRSTQGLWWCYSGGMRTACGTFTQTRHER